MVGEKSIVFRESCSLVTKNSLIEEKLENMKLETGGGGLCIDKPDNLKVFRF